MSDQKELTEAAWARLAPLLPTQQGKRGQPRLSVCGGW
jgi:hypothetical protein